MWWSVCFGVFMSLCSIPRTRKRIKMRRNRKRKEGMVERKKEGFEERREEGEGQS